eukprot:2458469-Pleurochrysis_carterae.AAC.1
MLLEPEENLARGESVSSQYWPNSDNVTTACGRTTGDGVLCALSACVAPVGEEACAAGAGAAGACAASGGALDGGAKGAAPMNACCGTAAAGSGDAPFTFCAVSHMACRLASAREGDTARSDATAPSARAFAALQGVLHAFPTVQPSAASLLLSPQSPSPPPSPSPSPPSPPSPPPSPPSPLCCRGHAPCSLCEVRAHTVSIISSMDTSE